MTDILDTYRLDWLKTNLRLEDECELRAIISATGYSCPRVVLCHWIRKSDYPLEVCLHAVRASIAFGVSLTTKDAGYWRFEEDLSSQDLLKIRFLELAGKIAAKEAKNCEWVSGHLYNILSSPTGEWFGFRLTSTREEALEKMQKFYEQAAGWNNWQERTGYVMFVKNRLAAKLQELASADAQSSIANTLVLLEDKHLWDAFSKDTEVSDMVKRAEAVTARLEQLDRVSLAEHWLFKAELEKERQELDNWVSSPYWVDVVRKSLAERISTLIPFQEFSEDEWSSDVENWGKEYEE